MTIDGHQGEGQHRTVVLILLHLAVYGLSAYLVQGRPVDWLACGLAGVLIWISVTDIMRYEIPELGWIALLFSGLFFAALGWSVSISEALLGVVIWPTLFWGLAEAFYRLRGFDGLGFGDVKLISGIAAWLGFGETIWVVMAAAISGVFALSVFALCQGKAQIDLQKTPVAFGAFLCLSAWVIWIS